MQALLKQIKASPFLPQPGQRIMAAVSGGADSVALLLLLRQLAGEFNWQLNVAHVNHGLRAQAMDDANFVASLASKLGLPFLLAQARIAKQGMAPEEAARVARQNALLGLAQNCNAAYIALAHHANDQAETVLMRLVNGTGPSGLAAMRPYTPPWWRPLLNLTSQDLRGLLQRLEQPWCEDHTNAQLHFTRNRVRHELLPLLGQKFNPQVIAALGRLASLCAAEDDHWLAWAKAQNALRQDDADWLIELKPAWTLAEKRRFLRFALSTIYGKGQHVQAVHIDELINLSQNHNGKQMPLPGGWRAWQEGHCLALSNGPDKPWAPLVLQGPASFYWPDQNTWYSMEQCAVASKARGPIAWLPYDQISWPLVLRRPQKGESFVACQGSGRRRINWLLQDLGVPRRKRARVLLLLDGKGPWWLGPLIAHQRIAESQQSGQWLKIFPASGVPPILKPYVAG